MYLRGVVSLPFAGAADIFRVHPARKLIKRKQGIAYHAYFKLCAEFPEVSLVFWHAIHTSAYIAGIDKRSARALRKH